MWYADKAAIRAGYVDGSRWDTDSIGVYSTGFGVNVIAANFGSTAIGTNAKAVGFASTSIGFETNAQSNYSTAIGIFANTFQEYATSIGYFNDAKGMASTAMGAVNKTKALGSFVLGTYNDTLDAPDPLAIAMSDRLFQIGNGYGATRSNAMTVLRNGNTGIGTTNPLTALHIKSNQSNPVIIDGGSNLYVTLAENGTNLGYIGSFTGNADDVEFGTYSGNSAALHLTTNNTPRLTLINNGNIGIGTVNPTEKLQVAGNMKSDTAKSSAFKYSTPKTSYYSIPDAEFTSANSSYLVFKTGGTGGAYITNAPGVGSLLAPLHLPHGALLTSMTFDFYDASPTQDISGQLILQNNGFVTNFSSVQSSGSGGTNSQTIIYNVPINNELFAYYVSVSATTGAWNNNDIRIRRVLIQYTLNETQ
jgi:hypothetical protein